MRRLIKQVPRASACSTGNVEVVAQRFLPTQSCAWGDSSQASKIGELEDFNMTVSKDLFLLVIQDQEVTQLMDALDHCVCTECN
eukprot:5488546-Amphidinium_carterae.2